MAPGVLHDGIGDPLASAHSKGAAKRRLDQPLSKMCVHAVHASTLMHVLNKAPPHSLSSPALLRHAEI